jgi:hypothetical protein
LGAEAHGYFSESNELPLAGFCLNGHPYTVNLFKQVFFFGLETIGFACLATFFYHD